MKRSLFILTSCFVFILAGILSYQAWSYSCKFQRYKLAYTSELNFESSLLDVTDYLNSNEWKSTQAKSKKTWKKSYRAKHSAIDFCLGLGGLIFVYLFLFGYLFRRKKTSLSQLGFVILNSSLICLTAGILLPFIELGAFMKDLNIDLGIGIAKTFEGKIYFFYQSKTVLQLVETLFTNGNWIVGVSIFLFSVVLPFSKLILFYTFLYSQKISQNHRLLKIASYMGKYSMADIFVAASFLAFLSFNNLNVGIQTESTTLPGLYFFLAYCLISIGTYYVVKKNKLVNLD